MQDKEKLIYLELALRMQNIGLEKKTLHRIIKTYDKILIKKGNTDLQASMVLFKKLIKLNNYANRIQ